MKIIGRLRQQTTLNLFTIDKLVVRPYTSKDFEQLVEVYKSAFSEPPWNETWSTEEIAKDLNYAITQQKNIILVAESNNLLKGFTWGYKTPLEEFPFLKGKIIENSNYIDEIAVRGNTRTRGIGTTLGINYIQKCKDQGIEQILLRTDERNIASMTLFKKLGFEPIKNNTVNVYDPQYASRIYLFMEVEK